MMESPLSLPLDAIYTLLRRVAGNEQFWPLWHTCFGDGYDRALTMELQRQWREGDFSALPRIVVLTGEALGGARGAYAVDTDTIYMAEAFVRGANEEALVAVILEELGHGVDARINERDSPGDEGDIFSTLVRGEPLPEAKLAALKAEEDHGWLEIDGRRLAVEHTGGIIRLVLLPESVAEDGSTKLTYTVMRSFPDYDAWGTSLMVFYYIEGSASFDTDYSSSIQLVNRAC